MVSSSKVCAVFLLCWIFSACGNSVESKNAKNIMIDNTSIADRKDILNLIDTVEISQLKEVSGNYIGDPFKFFVEGDKIIMFDRIHSKKVNAYDLKGNFIKNLLRVSDSINSPLQLNDCWLNHKGEVEVYDYSTKHIFQFDSLLNKKGIIRGDKKYLFMSLINTVDSKGYVGYTNFDSYNPKYNGNYFHLGFLDSCLKLKSAELMYDEAYRGVVTYSYRTNFFYLRDTIRMVCKNDNSIYSIDDNSNVTTYATIKYKFNSLPPTSELYSNVLKPHLSTLADNSKGLLMQDEIYSKYAFFDGLWFENPNWIYLTSRNTNYRPFITMIDKTSNNNMFSAQVLYASGIYDFTFPAFQYYYPKTNTFYSVYSGDFIYQYQQGHVSKFLSDNKCQNSSTVLYIVKCKFKK